MKISVVLILGLSNFITFANAASTPEINDISNVISKEEFSLYKDVGEFIDHSPKVTITVPADKNDITEFGKGVVKTLTGSDCDRDGKMDDNPTCNAVYFKLWLKYKR